MFNQISVSNNQAVDSHPTLSTQKSGKEELGGPASNKRFADFHIFESLWICRSAASNGLGRTIIARHFFGSNRCQTSSQISPANYWQAFEVLRKTENMRTVATADPECKWISHIF